MVQAQMPLLNRADYKHYQKLSRRSETCPVNYDVSPYHLARYLTMPARSDLEKVRGIYVWIANNITYDMQGYKSGDLPDYRPKGVLNSKLAVCEGYARLFNKLCREAGVESEIIRGYSKGYGYKKGETFTSTNHSWNAVLVDGKWCLVDVTWAARKSNDRKLIYPLNEAFFLASPEVFIVDHLPEIPAWQLLSHPVSKSDFEQDNIVIVQGNYHYRDSLNVILKLNPSEKAIVYQLKARQFNPENDATNYRLAIEYRFRALDSLDAVYKINEKNFFRFKQMEKQVFADLDKAALYFTLIKPTSRYYESAQNFLDDTVFERGVFKYEVAHRLLEIYATFPTQKKEAKEVEFEQMVLQYYHEAATYFSEIATNSWYYESAQGYLKFDLNNPFTDHYQAVNPVR